MHIEPAHPADIPALCDLLAALFAQEAEFRPDREAQTRGLRRVLDDAGIGTVLVAREAGEVLGMGSLLYTVSTALGGRVALLEDLVVRPGSRGAGIGSALVDALIAHARSQGCLRITLLTDGGNARAQALYARHGFVVSSMLPMRCLLGTAGAATSAFM